METKGMFETPLDYYFRVRRQKAIMQAFKFPSGKFFCWHDYTNLTEMPTLQNGILKYPVQCVKCGKRKYVSGGIPELLP